MGTDAEDRKVPLVHFSRSRVSAAGCRPPFCPPTHISSATSATPLPHDGRALEKCILVSCQVCSFAYLDSSATTAWSSKPEDAEHACNAASNAITPIQYARSVSKPTDHASGTRTNRLACDSKMSPRLPKGRPGDLETRRINRPTLPWQSSNCQSRHLKQPSQSHWMNKHSSTGHKPTSPMPNVCTKPPMSGTRTCFRTG
jgi:hypothetical protein